MGDSLTAAKLAIELWKLLTAFERAATNLPAEKVAKTAAQIRFSRSRLTVLLQEAGLSLLTFDGESFSVNLPASPINGEDLELIDGVKVASTIEPAIISDGKVILVGKVFLKED